MKILWARGIAFAIISIVAAGPLAAQQAGTEAVIDNTATTNYRSGTASFEEPTNRLAIPIDELIDVRIDQVSPATEILGNDPTIGRFRLINEGTGDEQFSVRVEPFADAGGFTPVIDAIIIDSDGNGIAEPNVDLVLNNGGLTPAMAPGQQLEIFVQSSLPVDAQDRAAGGFRIVADAQTGTGDPGAAFAGLGAGGNDAIVGTTGASADGDMRLTAALARVTTNKTAAILDPLGGNRAVVGSRITYRLTASATGSGSARDVVITDTIPAGTSFVAGSLSINGNSLSDAADNDAGNISGNVVRVALGSLAGGEERTISFTVVVNTQQ